jgi:hypothetical protein
MMDLIDAFRAHGLQDDIAFSQINLEVFFTWESLDDLPW